MDSKDRGLASVGKPAWRPRSLNLQLLNLGNAIHCPFGEYCGSESKSIPAGIEVTRWASACVTPSGSDAGMIQMPCCAG
jgi:hypothetical protein